MRLFYREFGSGIPLVILHGLYGSSDNWVSIARKLSDRFRVIVPDQRNHGASSHHVVHTYDEMSRDLNELTAGLGLDKFYLTGHSMGGKTAMWYASKWPEKLAGLMIIDISPFKSGPANNPQADFHRKVLDVINGFPLKSLKTREEAESILSNTISSPRIRKFLLKNLSRSEDKRFRWKLNPVNLENNIDNILDGFNRLDVANNSISGFPVIFVRAGNSDYIPESDYKVIKVLFPATEIITVEETSHWIHAEKPDVIIDLIRDLLE